MPQSKNTSPAAVRCVAFDAVGTLIFADPPVADAYARIGACFGSQQSAADVARRFHEAFSLADRETAIGDEAGRTHEQLERRFWRRIVSDVLPDAHDQEQCFAALFEHFALPSSWRCFDDVAPTLAELSARGFRIVIGSNFDARLHKVCDGLPELRDIRDRVISSLVGYRKSHLGFFAALCRTAECSPQEVLMIGDDWNNDVVAARAAGLSAWHLHRDSQPTDADRESLHTLTDLLERLP